MIYVVYDADGVRMALEEIFEGDLVRARIERDSAGADERTRERMACQIPPRTLSPGYYEFAQHLLRLESQLKTGIGLSARDVAGFELQGLLALGRARSAFEGRHPACSNCDARQPNRFGAECIGCGVKFARKKAR